MRRAEIGRDTKETRIALRLLVEGKGRGDIETGIGFLDHMLTLFAFHGQFDLYIRCAGDTQVDGHHSAEDLGIALGEALREALGDKKGIRRYGSCLLPMDEALVLTALDISGRACLVFNLPLGVEKIGTFDAELVKEFFLGLCRALGLTLHIRMLAGENAHHICEAAFKGFGRALREACAIERGREGEIPSSKGLI